jgi:hypothetical protein
MERSMPSVSMNETIIGDEQANMPKSPEFVILRHDAVSGSFTSSIAIMPLANWA